MLVVQKLKCHGSVLAVKMLKCHGTVLAVKMLKYNDLKLCVCYTLHYLNTVFVHKLIEINLTNIQLHVPILKKHIHI